MCMSLPPEDLNSGPWSYTPQAIIYVEWPLYQECAVVKIVAVGVVESIDYYFIFFEKKKV